MTENICKALGCMADCCRKKERFLIQRENPKDYFPEARQVEYNDLTEIRVPGVYYTFSNNDYSYHIRIVGPCPNLDEKFNCVLWPNHPPACGNGLGVNSEECVLFQAQRV